MYWDRSVRVYWSIIPNVFQILAVLHDIDLHNGIDEYCNDSSELLGWDMLRNV